jgi:hypothetical protein
MLSTERKFLFAASFVALTAICFAIWAQVQIPSGDRLIFIGWAQLIVFIAQLFVFGYQALKLHETVKAASEQSGDMKESIRQATRAATAMETSAEAATRASKAVAESVAYIGHQVRAYLSVRVNGGLYQERSKKLRFEVKPLLINTGLTPAFKIRYTANAGVFPFNRNSPGLVLTMPLLNNNFSLGRRPAHPSNAPGECSKRVHVERVVPWPIRLIRRTHGNPKKGDLVANLQMRYLCASAIEQRDREFIRLPAE